MESPVFRLEGIVKTKDETTDFEGPLTLILQLLSKDKIEIRDISISQILEQYLEFLDKMAELDLDIASEFVAMASHLAYIKTKMLLSGSEEVSELEQLINTLEKLRREDVYLQIKAVSHTLSGMYTREGVMLAGPPEYFSPDGEYKYVHNSGDLSEALVQIIGRENSMLDSMNRQEASYPRRIVYSIPAMISEILNKLRQRGEMPVIELFHECKNRTELIATLVAVLELCRVGNVLMTGAADEITIAYTGAVREPDYSEEG